MSGTAAAADSLLRDRGVRQDFGAFVVGVAFDAARVCMALGDGTLRIARLDALQEWRAVEAHRGAVLALAAGGEGFFSGGDDGLFAFVDAAGAVAPIAEFGGKWVEQVAVSVVPKGRTLACAVGRRVHVFDVDRKPLKTLDHPSTVTGLVFDAKGKRIAASHVNGASLWFVSAKADTPRKLEWKGSHIGIAISPDADAVVTAMQENALHGWRLSDGQHMRMSGYPGKTRAMGFTRNGKWLATSGADSVVLWPFFGGGPMGKAPTELAGGDGLTCTALAVHPDHEAVAAGFSDGTVVLADIQSARVLPVCPPGHGPVSAIAWNAEGTHLGFGTETGFGAVVDFSKRG